MAVFEGTIVSNFLGQVERLGDASAMRYRDRDSGEWRDISWAAYGAAAREVAMGLAALGVAKGGAVAVFSPNRPEWHIADLGSMCSGAMTVPIYLNNAPPQVAYVAGHSGSRVAFVAGEEQLRKIEKVRDEAPGLEHAVIFDGGSSADGFVLSWEDMRARGRTFDAEHPGEFERRVAGVGPDDVATIVYTSGTTGMPKGAILSHRNVVWTTDSLLQVFTEGQEGRRLSYLPLAHIAERVSSHFVQAFIGSQTWFAQGIDTLLQDLQDCRPTVFFAVPRVWEKFHAGLMAKLAERDEGERQMFEGLLTLAMAAVELRQAGEEITEESVHNLQMADQMAFGPIRERLGLDQVRFAVSGAAPINPELLTFWHAIGIPVAEVYGQTEDCGPATLNPPDRIKIGTVGPALPGVEVRLAEDGEILIRGGNVFQGYFKNPEGTAAALQDGWLSTGDVGELDEDGYLTITDRKKDLIITAAGKNIAPQELESRLKYHPLVSQSVVIGDRRPYLVALITLDPEALARFAAERGLTGTGGPALHRHPDVQAAVAGAVAAVNAGFSSAEQIKKWTILPRDFLVEEEEITPTLKVRRRAIIQKYDDGIEALYA
jgi:long-chain acyl-CoA synthetase